MGVVFIGRLVTMEDRSGISLEVSFGGVVFLVGVGFKEEEEGVTGSGCIERGGVK